MTAAVEFFSDTMKDSPWLCKPARPKAVAPATPKTALKSASRKEAGANPVDFMDVDH
jgi:hypothetical protein